MRASRRIMLHTPSPVWGEIYWEDDLAVVIQKDLNSKEQHAPSYHRIVSQNAISQWNWETSSWYILFRQFDEMYHCLMIKSRRLRKINPNQAHPLPCSMYPTYPSPGTKRILLQQNKTDDKQPRQTLALIINGNCGGNSYISAQLILLYFAPFLEKVLDVQWLLQWMVWPLLATDISRQSAPQRKAAWKRIFSLISFSAERFFFVV